ncbi:MAG: class I SAM-dependent methyltransferase [Ginsengibacter sp.]
MNDTSIAFNGSIPENYDKYLGGFIFEPYALDLLSRIDITKDKNVLELACGTGRLTRHLVDYLPGDAVVTATDINPAMLRVGQEKILSFNIFWDTVDISNIPYEEEQFDLVICQFGLMFVPDKLKAITGIQRVLKKGGRLLFSVWGDIDENDLWKIGHSVIQRYLNLPVNGEIGPFSMTDEKATLALLQQGGFRYCDVDPVKITAVSPTAADAAKGFVLGLPFYTAIMNNDPLRLNQIQDSLSEALANELGDRPLRSRLRAWIFEGVK